MGYKYFAIHRSTAGLGGQLPGRDFYEWVHLRWCSHPVVRGGKRTKSRHLAPRSILYRSSAKPDPQPLFGMAE